MDTDFETLTEIARNVWQTFLNRDVEPAPSDALLDVAWSASVEIRGDWSGRLVLEVSSGLAERAARDMLGPDAGDTGPTVLAELANILAGNFKGTLPGHNTLGLPRVDHASDVLPERNVRALVLACEGVPFRISIARAEPAAIH